MVIIDLNFKSPKCHTSSSTRKEMAHEFRENHFLPAHGLSCQPTNFDNASSATTAITRSNPFPAGINSSVWPLPNSLIAKVSAISKPASGAAKQKLYHMGFRGKVSRNTLAHANQVRDWRIYADFAQILITQARSLYAHEDFGVELKQTVYAFDATTIDLCLSLFPWAKFRQRKGAIKLHTLMDLRGSIPTLIFVTQGKIHEVNLLDDLLIEPGAIYIFDRGYLDFARLYNIHQSGPFSSSGPKAISVSGVFIPNQSTNRKAFKPIRSSNSMAFMPAKIIPNGSAGFVTSMPRRKNG